MEISAVIFTTIAILCQASFSMGGSFTIDLDNNTFLKDGKPFQYVSGSIHYSRVPHYYWADRLQKMFAAGLDAAQTYVPWNIHEPMPGVYDFSGQQDIIKFLKTAQEAGLVVILRGGPYICGEWEYGGFPAWLLSDNATMVVRSMDAKYIKAVDRWLSVFLPTIKPYLYNNGGPVVMVQIENEYGSYRSVDCGHDYMSHLRDAFRQYLGDDIILFTTDGNAEDYLKCGAIDNVYATVDFGPTGDIAGAFAAMRKWNPKGPLKCRFSNKIQVNSEYYTGWLDYWGGGHSHGDTNSIVNGLKAIRAYGANVNMYMFEGGTNFGFMNGADPTFSVCPTSYDYDSPLTEAGDITPKYLAIRNFTSTYKKLPDVPPNTPKFAYGRVSMTSFGAVVDLLDIISPGPAFTSVYPLNMEQANYFYGFVLYRNVLTGDYPNAQLQATGIRDRGYVLVDGIPRGLLNRNGLMTFSMFATKGQILDIIVENEGRINFGSDINSNKKGLVSNVTLNGNILSGWSMHALNFTNIFPHLQDSRLKFRRHNFGVNSAQLPYQPTVYSGQFVLPSSVPVPRDTYLNMCGWFKGQAYINGFNLGRYWPAVGPQVTLYVPAGVLNPHPQANVIVMVELEHSPLTATMMTPNSIDGSTAAANVVEFVDQPNIEGRCVSQASIERIPPSTRPASRTQYNH